MGALRSSDHAVAAAVAVALWLLVRTALRVEPLPATLAVAAGYFAALAARWRAGERRADVSIELGWYALGLSFVRVSELAWDHPRATALRELGVWAATAVAVALTAKRRGAGGWLVLTLLAVVALGAGLGVFELALSLAVLALLAPTVGRWWAAAEFKRWSRWGRWIVALVAAGWATRGATVGPLALMVSAAGGAGGVLPRELAPWDVGARRELTLLSLGLGVAAEALSATRAWERCALLFS